MSVFLQGLITQTIWIGVFFLPAALLVWRIAHAKKKYDEEAKKPFDDLPLRLPGESTRAAAHQHFERTLEWTLLLVATCALLGFAVAMTPAAQRATVAPLFGALTLVVALIVCPRALKSLRSYWNYQLGFLGERFVAEELNQLLTHGWRVFHDVPFNGFNVDHIAVGPAGVFSVETKTKRKWDERATKHPSHVVKWNGRTLTWPSGAANNFGLDQAGRNAKTVADFLTESTGTKVECQPVLTLPGWWIEFEGRGPVIVASTKGLHRVLMKYGNAHVSPELLQRMTYQLEQKCRPKEGI